MNARARSTTSRPRRSRVGSVARELRAVAPGSWDGPAIITALQDWTAAVGRPPRAYEWSSTGAAPGAARWLAEHPRWPSAGTVAHHFGGWSDGLRAAGLPAVAVEHELPRRERIAAALALRAAGESVRAIAEQLGVHERTVLRYLAAGVCGGCGGPALYSGQCVDCVERSRPAATAEEIVAALRAWTAEHGAPPRQEDWSDASAIWREAWPRWPGASTVHRVYGSWNGALGAAGLPTHRYAWTREEALERLAAWARAHGRAPVIADARADPSVPGLGSCQLRFGSWNAALRAAGLSPGHEPHWSDERVHAVLAAWARWHIRQARGEPSQASYRRWAAQQPGPVPSASSIRRRFGGSWNAARVAAGQPASRAGRRPRGSQPSAAP